MFKIDFQRFREVAKTTMLCTRMYVPGRKGKAVAFSCTTNEWFENRIHFRFCQHLHIICSHVCHYAVECRAKIKNKRRYQQHFAIVVFVLHFACSKLITEMCIFTCEQLLPIFTHLIFCQFS